MKKQFKFLAIFTLTVLTAFSIINELSLISVNATYVEGHITQDTTWTLTDSPYIVTKDVIIDSGVTLTIMPGVEVRFGGNFVLAAVGRLSAVGTVDRKITFTSNKLEPQAGDWNTIKFNGTLQSTLAYATIVYATKGVTIENGKAEIRNSVISYCSQSGVYATGANEAAVRENTIRSNQNGILVEGSTSGVSINNNEVSSNTQNGIYVHAQADAKVAWDYQKPNATAYIHDVFVSGNNVSSNGNGIYLHSQSIANASINFYGQARANSSIDTVTLSNNLIKSNTNNGIFVQAEARNWFDSYYSTQSTQWAEANASIQATVYGNTVSANQKGVYESGLTSITPQYATPLHQYVQAQENVNITRNSISYSTFGVLLEKGKDNVANYNDVYSNTYGMNVTQGATVNAEYNFWGHSSGPYHVSLNPSGQGDPVNGDGVNLDFIPFLTAPSGEVNERPTAQLMADKNTVALNQPVTFDGSTSTDDRRVDKYFFDFGDGENSGWTTLSVFMHNYTSAGTYNARLTVMDDFGVLSDNSATLAITAIQLPPLSVALTVSRSTAASLGQVSLTVYVTNGTAPMQNASVKLVSNKGGSFATAFGYTNSSGYYKMTYTAPNVTQQTNVRITATASKSGFADGSDYEDLEVLPPGAPSLTVQILLSPSSLLPFEVANVTVHVTYNANAVANVTVKVSSDMGNLTKTDGMTDANGDFKLVWIAPQATVQLNATISATATKSGYLEGEGEEIVTVNPEVISPNVGGIPLTMILLILVPVIAVAVAVVILLIRKRRAAQPGLPDQGVGGTGPVTNPEPTAQSTDVGT